jgi:hypothetical protein
VIGSLSYFVIFDYHKDNILFKLAPLLPKIGRGGAPVRLLYLIDLDALAGFVF